ncbi:TPA: SDR family oxidoreductase [Enterococcus faecium]|nr:SDR family oxidoreductase [Enterococcus faecium]EME8168452.1 SDR family oxidoreductase [Enterococcus faecium]
MNKLVVIIGGTGGIGWSTALKFLSNGYKIHIIDLNTPSETQKSLGKSAIYFHKCDISKYDELKVIFQNIRTIEKTKISTLVISAAIQIDETWENFNILDSDKILKNNLYGTLYCLLEGTKYIVEKGSIVNVSSIHSKVPRKGRYSYDVAKSGIEILIQELAVEYGAKGIRINNIEPGCIDTPMNNFYNLKDSRIISKIPLGYIGKTDEVAELIYFLSSDSASYITGTSIPIDGGRRLMK